MSMTSICTQKDSDTGLCMRWSSSGSMKYERACFPGNSRVHMYPSFESKQISDIKIGDLIYGWDNNSIVVVNITGWFHRVVDSISLYLKVDDIILSREHFLWNGMKQDFYPASTFSVGDTIRTINGIIKNITEIYELHEWGMFNPITNSSTASIFVNGIACHPFMTSHVQFLSPSMIKFLSSYFKPTHDDDYVHPLIDFFLYLHGGGTKSKHSMGMTLEHKICNDVSCIGKLDFKKKLFAVKVYEKSLNLRERREASNSNGGRSNENVKFLNLLRFMTQTLLEKMSVHYNATVVN